MCCNESIRTQHRECTNSRRESGSSALLKTHSDHLCTSCARRSDLDAHHFKWVNTCLGNITSALTGTHRHLDGKHAPWYLAGFQYRINRRYDLKSIVCRLSSISMRIPSIPLKQVKPSHYSWLSLMRNQDSDWSLMLAYLCYRILSISNGFLYCLLNA